ncbi:MAG: hypothetical protein K2Q20_11240 [Phycisphaerales bacterium]|nr:hypothetical protein [Phycisphaerales bacterium]
MPEPAPSSRSGTPSAVCVQTEVESDRGWTFGVTFGTGNGGNEAAEMTLTLSWVDYEYWSHGSFSPSRVAEAVLVALREAEPGRGLPARMDASTARRLVRDFDQRVRDAL